MISCPGLCLQDTEITALRMICIIELNYLVNQSRLMCNFHGLVNNFHKLVNFINLQQTCNKLQQILWWNKF